MISIVPETSELYRRLLDQLTTKFGGAIDETNAEAIAYAATELYHCDIELRLWQEKPAHDVLDLFGVPRAGVFSPYSLSERLVVFQRRASGAEHASRAHDLLTALGVPRQDETGQDQSLNWRLQQFLTRPNEGDHRADAAVISPGGEHRVDVDEELEGTAGPVVDDEATPSDTSVKPHDSDVEDEEAEEAAEAEPAEAEAKPEEAVKEAAEEEPLEEALEEAEAAAEAEEAAEEEAEDDPAEVAKEEAEQVAEAEQAAEAEEETKPSGIEKAREPDEEAEEVYVDGEPGAAPLVEAVRALEQAARVEAELSQAGLEGPGGVDLVQLSNTLNGIHAELAALRTLIESLGNELRERIEAVHEEVLVATGVLGPEPGRNVLEGPYNTTTHDLPPVPAEVEPEPEKAGRLRHSVALVVLLVVLGLLIAGAVIVVSVYGWDRVRSELTGVVTSANVALCPPVLRDLTLARGATS